MTLAGVYGFWKYVSNLDRRETRRYLEMFYALKYRDLVSIYATFEKLNYYVLLVMQIFMVCSSIFYFRRNQFLWLLMERVSKMEASDTRGRRELCGWFVQWV